MLNISSFRISPDFLSEHTVLVGRIFGHRLSHIPEFHDAIALEAEDMDCSNTRIAGFQSDVRMYGYQVSIFKSTQDLNDLIRKLSRILFHSGAERCGIAPEIGVVVPKV